MRVARMNNRQQRRREEALMGRNRLAELLPRARGRRWRRAASRSISRPL